MQSERDGAVTIVRFASTTVNETFQETHLTTATETHETATTTATDHQPWLISIHELKYNRDDPIGKGASRCAGSSKRVTISAAGDKLEAFAQAAEHVDA
ncbi:Tkl/tkl-ccin protein kinase [Globisporangium polare]